MRLDIWTMIVSSLTAIVLAVTLTLLVVLVTGAEWGTPEADPHVQQCYDLMVEFTETEDDSPEEDAIFDRMDDEECFF